MEPVAVWIRRGGEWAIIHRCQRCAGDDNPLALLSLAVRPLAMPPFPLDRLGNEHPRTPQKENTEAGLIDLNHKDKP